MARPMKAGIDYFPFDVGFLRDKKIKLLKGEFGPKGILILLHLLCSIYETDGYYMSWDNDDRFLVSETLGHGCDPTLVEEVVSGCLKRSIFDEGVFKVFGVLTSAGIQRRYIRAKRGKIHLRADFILLDFNNEDDVPANIKKRISFLNDENIVSVSNNQVSDSDNATKESKVKKSKEEESKVKKTGFPIDLDFSEVISLYEACGFRVNGSTGMELPALIDEYSKEWVMEAIKEAADMNKPTLGYAKGILVNWRAAGKISRAKTQQKIDWDEI